MKRVCAQKGGATCRGSFQVGPGEFQIATEWDQELFDLDNFGIQLVGPGIAVVPSPGAVGLLALGGLAGSRRRRTT